MAEKITNDEPKVLLTPDEDGKLNVVTGMGDDGKLKTASPAKENANSFLQFNMHGNALENFVKRFAEQSKNPTHTGLYAVTGKAVDKIGGFLEKVIGANPDDKVLDPYRVSPEGEVGQQNEGMRFQPLDLNNLDWNEVDKLGLSGESLQDALKAMSYGHKSPGLLEIRMEIDGKELQGQARLSLERQPDGTIKVQTHPKQEKPDFDKPFMGVTFTEQDIEQFRQTGNGGRVFDLEREPGGEKVPSLVSLDRMTNRFEAMALSDIAIPQTLKNAPLSDDQQSALKRGEGVLIEGMDKKIRQGEEPSKIDRIVQYNAVNRNFDFRFTEEQRQQHRQEQDDKPLKARKVGDVWVRPVQGGVELTRDQFRQLCEGKPVWVEGMQKQSKPQEGAPKQVEATDRKGQKYNAWVWADPEKGRVRHTSRHPDELKGQKVTPTDEHKTQVAVNNEGKTNEATKHSQGEPLKKGQTDPTEKQAAKKREYHGQRRSPAPPQKGNKQKM